MQLRNGPPPPTPPPPPPQPLSPRSPPAGPSSHRQIRQRPQPPPPPTPLQRPQQHDHEQLSRLDGDGQALSQEALSLLPLHIQGCQTLLILGGQMQPRGLLGALELFTFITMGGSRAQIRLIQLGGPPQQQQTGARTGARTPRVGDAASEPRGHVGEATATAAITAAAEGSSAGGADLHGGSLGARGQGDGDLFSHHHGSDGGLGGPLYGPEQLFRRFDAARTNAESTEGRERLLAIIEASFGDSEPFSSFVQRVFTGPRAVRASHRLEYSGPVYRREEVETSVHADRRFPRAAMVLGQSSQREMMETVRSAEAPSALALGGALSSLTRSMPAISAKPPGAPRVSDDISVSHLTRGTPTHLRLPLSRLSLAEKLPASPRALLNSARRLWLQEANESSSSSRSQAQRSASATDAHGRHAGEVHPVGSESREGSQREHPGRLSYRHSGHHPRREVRGAGWQANETEQGEMRIVQVVTSEELHLATCKGGAGGRALVTSPSTPQGCTDACAARDGDARGADDVGAAQEPPVDECRQQRHQQMSITVVDDGPMDPPMLHRTMEAAPAPAPAAASRVTSTPMQRGTGSPITPDSLEVRLSV